MKFSSINLSSRDVTISVEPERYRRPWHGINPSPDAIGAALCRAFGASHARRCGYVIRDEVRESSGFEPYRKQPLGIAGHTKKTHRADDISDEEVAAYIGFCANRKLPVWAMPEDRIETKTELRPIHFLDLREFPRYPNEITDDRKLSNRVRILGGGNPFGAPSRPNHVGDSEKRTVIKLVPKLDGTTRKVGYLPSQAKLFRETREKCAAELAKIRALLAEIDRASLGQKLAICAKNKLQTRGSLLILPTCGETVALDSPKKRHRAARLLRQRRQHEVQLAAIPQSVGGVSVVEFSQIAAPQLREVSPIQSVAASVIGEGAAESLARGQSIRATARQIGIPESTLRVRLASIAELVTE